MEAAQERNAALPEERLSTLAPVLHAQQNADPHFAVLRAVQEEVAGRIIDAFSMHGASCSLTDEAGTAVFHSLDKKSDTLVQVFQGDRGVAWLAKPTTCVNMFLNGGRVNAFLSSGHTYAPNLDIEFYHYLFSKKVFIYLNLVPRRSLIEHPEDIERFYTSPAAAVAGAAAGNGAAAGSDAAAEGASPQSMHGLWRACEQDPRWEAYSTKSAYIRALTGATSLMFQIDQGDSTAAAEEVAALIRRVADLWLGFATDETAPRPETEEQRRQLEATDAALLSYARRDPDNKQAAAFMGEEVVENMQQLLTRDEQLFPKMH